MIAYYLYQLWRRALARYATNRARYAHRVVWGKGSRIINGFTRITTMRGVAVGKNVRIMDGGYFQTEGGLMIGDDTVISRNVTILTATHEYERTQGHRPFHPTDYRYRQVVIGEGCWIGQNVTLLPGTKLGERCVVQAGAVVRGAWPSGSVVLASVSTQSKALEVKV